jgi:exosome complex exonuclease RRP6
MFKDSINNEDVPFVPKLRVKHHKLEQKTNRGMILTGDSNQRQWPSDLDSSQQHPYEAEILNFKVPKKQLSFSIFTTKLKSLEDTPLIVVETEDDLKKLVNTLNNVNEFAVDLEHHSYRSFLGITCLMQISTRDEDYIIDPFPIWNSMWMLNEPFTNPNILKVEIKI